MPTLSPEVFLSTLALIGAVIVVSALLSGFVERSGLPQVIVFLGLGAVIGPAGLNLVDSGIDSPILRVVATLSLVLVLFTDAVSLDLKEVRERKLLALLVVGPGTILSAALIALSATGCSDFPFRWPQFWVRPSPQQIRFYCAAFSGVRLSHRECDRRFDWSRE